MPLDQGRYQGLLSEGRRACHPVLLTQQTGCAALPWMVTQALTSLPLYASGTWQAAPDLAARTWSGSGRPRPCAWPPCCCLMQ